MKISWTKTRENQHPPFWIKLVVVFEILLAMFFICIGAVILVIKDSFSWLRVRL